MRRNSGWKLDNREIKNLAFKSAPMDTKLPKGAAAAVTGRQPPLLLSPAAIHDAHRCPKEPRCTLLPSLDESVPEIELRVRNMCVCLIVSLSKENLPESGRGWWRSGDGRSPATEFLLREAAELRRPREKERQRGRDRYRERGGRRTRPRAGDAKTTGRD